MSLNAIESLSYSSKGGALARRNEMARPRKAVVTRIPRAGGAPENLQHHSKEVPEGEAALLGMQTARGAAVGNVDR
jgi:hypothetical protein